MMDSGISRDAAIQESENYVHYPALGLLRGDLGDHDLYVVTIRCSSFMFLTCIISHLICLPSSHFRIYLHCDPLVALPTPNNSFDAQI